MSGTDPAVCTCGADIVRLTIWGCPVCSPVDPRILRIRLKAATKRIHDLERELRNVYESQDRLERALEESRAKIAEHL